jgi:hypothetical protein
VKAKKKIETALEILAVFSLTSFAWRYVNERIPRLFPFKCREKNDQAIASNDLAEKSTELQFTCM